MLHVNVNNRHVRDALGSVPRARRQAEDDIARALVDAFRQEMDVPAAARDLTVNQLRLMTALRRSGPLSMHRLAQFFEVSQTAATGLVERVERHGLVERRHRSDDRRVVECQVTTKGSELLDELSGVRGRGLRNALALLSDDELAEFERLLHLISSRQPAAVVSNQETR